MKNLKSIALAMIMAIGTFTAQAQKVNVAKSTINWVGKKVTGQHSGTINFKDASLTFKNKKLTAGSFVVDMNSLNATDVTGEYQTKLNGHLKNDDFFGTDQFPTSTLVFKKIAAKAKGVYTVTGDLTIKGVTNAITFDLATSAKGASTTLKIDRTKFGIKYGSGSFFDSLGDKAIDNEFELKVNLQY
ncbi:YceI family protein [Flavobacterium branchiophilum]|uniref:Lipid-binding protein n=1 Tax=Flavobacterium branchiophilum TaxID=55197 RepID=A0A2H3KNY7_9FLAO|nr:YceI family protein [Flavobacterium branchiophilum]PDS25500.1 lipid-binding protein [Flavobacterium branchiophilum]